MKESRSQLFLVIISIIVLGCTNNRSNDMTFNMTHREDDYQHLESSASFVNIDSLFAEQRLNRIAIAFIDIDYQGEIDVYDNKHGIVTRSIKNDTSTFDFINLELIDKTDNMYYVVAFSSLTDSILAKGWIIRDSPIGIYNCMYQGNTVFYLSPDSSKVLFVEKEYNPEAYEVVDFSGSWLKIKIRKGNAFVEGWIPWNEQCWNVYTTCC